MTGDGRQGLRIFTAGGIDGEWTELTDGGGPAVRVAAPDLNQARRAGERVRAAGGADVAVILDVTVVIGRDFRAARMALGPVDTRSVLHHIGTVDTLAGLIADIGAAAVADGVTLIPAAADQDMVALGRDVLDRLATRRRARAS